MGSYDDTLGGACQEVSYSVSTIKLSWALYENPGVFPNDNLRPSCLAPSLIKKPRIIKISANPGCSSAEYDNLNLFQPKTSFLAD